MSSVNFIQPVRSCGQAVFLPIAIKMESKMKKLLIVLVLLLASLNARSNEPVDKGNIPHIDRQGGAIQFMVHGKAACRAMYRSG
jgi:hypothetical protein